MTAKDVRFSVFGDITEQELSAYFSPAQHGWTLNDAIEVDESYSDLGDNCHATGVSFYANHAELLSAFKGIDFLGWLAVVVYFEQHSGFSIRTVVRRHNASTVTRSELATRQVNEFIETFVNLECDWRDAFKIVHAIQKVTDEPYAKAGKPNESYYPYWYTQAALLLKRFGFAELDARRDNIVAGYSYDLLDKAIEHDIDLDLITSVNGEM